ncbi:MAG: type IV pilus assembly protein PilM [Deltaproteobacteria bacterium]|nr:type IV pilus assembly protein PilM [Deltaproteobacteria bacterium]MBW2045049.1 type IV pilus assembly protein PilM [Deltaproteobacteria bacterium]MBW2299294.1 type IV pilus assembly protein PilM [Deltaproteobacteria bacterium]
MAVPKKNQLVGLDIGSYSIKLVEIDNSKKGMILKNFGTIGLPHDAIVEGSIKEMEVVSSAIKNLYKNLKVKNKNVVTSISGYSVIVKKISIEKRKESELESSIQEEAEQYIPFDINDVNLDYEILSERAGEGGEEQAEEMEKDLMDVMLVAAKKDIVDDYVSLLQLTGLNPAILDVDAFALQNAFESSQEDISGCYALVNLGAEELGINAIKGGVSIFTRDSSYGGYQINEAIMSKFDVSYEDAEKMKLGGTKIEAKNRADMEEIFTSVVSGWVNEIKRALDFLATTYPDEHIEKIFVSGGSCRIPGFQKYLELETDIAVEELNPFVNLQINEKVFDPKYLSYMAPQAAVAVGLALRSIGDK